MCTTTILRITRLQSQEKPGAVVRYEYQQGKGNVIRRMFREIDAECYIMIDGDDTYPADLDGKWLQKYWKEMWIW